MTQLRLYGVRTGWVADACDGCHAAIAPRSQAVMRQDAALFCTEACAREHDDAPVGQQAVGLA